MSQTKGSSRQSHASRKLGQNSSVGQTIANTKKQEEEARIAKVKAEFQALAKQKKIEYELEKKAKQQEVLAQNRAMMREMEKKRLAQLLNEMPPKSEEQIEREKRLRERRAALNRAVR